MSKAGILLVVLAASGAAIAQNNSAAVLVGGHFPVDISSGISIGSAFMLEGSYTHRLASFGPLGADVEVPVVGSFHAAVAGPSFTGSGFALLRNYSSLFVVPGLKVNLAPNFFISPYVAGGIGLAHFTGSSTLTSNEANPQPGTNKFAFDVAGGLDIRFVRSVGMRLELRDVVTGLPLLSPLRLAETALGLSTHQHNVLAGIGLVLRF